MQRILETGWFFYRLSTALVWNSLVLGVQLHFATRSFLSVFGMFVCITILVIFRLLTWQTGYFSTTRYSTSTAIQAALTNTGMNFQEYVCLQTSCQTRRNVLAQLQAKQPTHRDILLNLLLASNGLAEISSSTAAITTTLQHLDPNHPLVSHLK